MKHTKSAFSSNSVMKEPHHSLSLLKLLREKQKVSRTELSKRTQLSTYQVEGLEGRGAQSQLTKIFLCIKALGYKAHDVLGLMDIDNHQNEMKFPRGKLGEPRSETSYQEGVRLLTYFHEKGSFFGQLQLPIGKSFKKENFPTGDIFLGIVREGTIVIDLISNQTVHKKDHFFVFPGNISAQLSNGDSYVPASILLFSLKYPPNTP